MTDLNSELKNLIVNALNLDDVNPEEIGSDDPLFAGGLGLDSIDALELAVALEKNYGIKLTMDQETKEKFYSVNTLTSLVKSLT
jgi:acyl carrier protein